MRKMSMETHEVLLDELDELSDGNVVAQGFKGRKGSIACSISGLGRSRQPRPLCQHHEPQANRPCLRMSAVVVSTLSLV